jgi:5-methylcytosine-specific restriction protein A
MPAIGRQLNLRYNLRAEHALFDRNGKWFHHLRAFPGILCDENGYVRFKTKAEYEKHAGLQHGQALHAPDGIVTFIGYTRFPSKFRSSRQRIARREVSSRRGGRTL